MSERNLKPTPPDEKPRPTNQLRWPANILEQYYNNNQLIRTIIIAYYTNKFSNIMFI